MQESSHQNPDPEESAANSPVDPNTPAEAPRDSAKARALARAEEDARIDASGRDEWYYIQNDEQYGPVPLAELKSKVSDLSISPPIKLAWHQGMEAWKPVYEIARVCGVSPLAATQAFKLPRMAMKPQDSMEMEGGVESDDA